MLSEEDHKMLELVQRIYEVPQCILQHHMILVAKHGHTTLHLIRSLIDFRMFTLISSYFPSIIIWLMVNHVHFCDLQNFSLQVLKRLVAYARSSAALLVELIKGDKDERQWLVWFLKH